MLDFRQRTVRDEFKINERSGIYTFQKSKIRIYVTQRKKVV